jgi:sulfoxide reductase heme-binding subunit YedZ
MVLALCLTPGAQYGFWWTAGALSGRAVNDVIHATGLWSVRFLLITLAVMPLSRLLDWPDLLRVRRMLGVTAGLYALAHLLLYIVEQKYAFGVVVSEIVSRLYLTIGFVTLLGLLALTATSTDAALRRMGRAWKRLHYLAYPLAALALWHYALQSKANVGEPVFAAGTFLWLMLWRASPTVWRAGWGAPVSLSVVAAALTIAIEAGWYGLAFGVDPWRLAASNLGTDFGVRPAQWVLLAGFTASAVTTARRVRRLSAYPPSGPIRAHTARGS